jgi:UDP-N-acetylglucosamine/UDP-N-acetyl-alpha-D-glucosaminouronate 4-epimerase
MMQLPPKYLVTGGAGFIGSHLVRRLLAEGMTVRVVDNLSTGHVARLSELLGAIEFIEGDLADDEVSQKAVKGIEYVLHQAALPSVQRSVQDPVGTNRANVTATLRLLESSRQAGVRRFVYAASSSAYGDTAVLPKKEEMTATPLSPYAVQKLVGEQYCKLYYDLYGLETVSLRYFNVFGPHQDPCSDYSAVIPKFTTRLLAGETITVYGDGEQSRDFTYIDNVVEANILALDAPNAAGNMCNIGCGERISLKQLVALLEKQLAISAQVTHAPPKAGDVRHSLADISRAKQILGYEPRIMVEEGLCRTIETIKISTSLKGEQ